MVGNWLVMSDERAAGAGAVVEQFQKIVPLVRSDRGNGQIVAYEQIQLGQLHQPPRKAAVTTGHVQFLQQARGTGVEHGEALARGLPQRRWPTPRAGPIR